MLISAVEDRNSFAVIGGGKAEAFQMESSAEAFHIVSDTLYRDKPLAVAREYIHNAVDAHVEIGKPDLPVRITLTDDLFEVADSGPGIPADKMVAVFCTIFASFKREDGRQIGGFGLGCKAGFSMTDHFTVTSCYGGERNVFALAAGSDETDGRPSCRRMTPKGIPCTETGLTVSIPLEPGQRALIETAMKKVIFEGGIRAICNDAEVPRRDYDALIERGWGLVATPRNSYEQIANPNLSPIKVLFGRALYPVDANAALDELIRELQTYSVPGHEYILSAPPSSIRPTPSRESISYNKLTLGTLTRLLKRAVYELRTEYKRAIRQELRALCHRQGRLGIARAVRSFSLPALTVDQAASGTREIALFLARNAIYNNLITPDDLRRALSGMLNEHRRSLARELTRFGGAESSKTTWGTRIERALSADANRLTRQKLFRALRKFGLETAVKVRNPGYDRFVNYKHNHKSVRGISPGLYIAAKIEDIHAYGTQSGSWSPIREEYFLTGQKLTEDQMIAIAIEVRKFGIRVAIIGPKPVAAKEVDTPAPKTEPEPRTFPPFALTRGDYDLTRDKKEFLKKPDYFVSAKVRQERYGQNMYGLSKEAVRYVARLRKNVAIAGTVHDATALVKNNVPRLEQHLLDRLTARLGRKISKLDRLLMEAAIYATTIPSNGDFLKRDRRSAQFMLCEPYKPDAESDDAYILMLATVSLLHCRDMREDNFATPNEFKAMSDIHAAYSALMTKHKLPGTTIAPRRSPEHMAMCAALETRMKPVLAAYTYVSNGHYDPQVKADRDLQEKVLRFVMKEQRIAQQQQKDTTE